MVADETVEKTCTVRNKLGVHARPAALIVQTANRFPCELTLVKDGQPVNGKSIMGVLMLAAPMGTSVTVRAEGEQAQQCADAIADLFPVLNGAPWIPMPHALSSGDDHRDIGEYRGQHVRAVSPVTHRMEDRWMQVCK